jgi:effector-binding domain-containing protein
LCVNCYYIGETTNFRNRFSTHKSCIINFKPLGKINSEVAEHFNLKGRNFNTNLKIIIFKSNIIDEDTRKSIEDELMFICDYTGISFINIRRRNLHYVKHLM